MLKFGSVKVKFTVNVIFLLTSVLQAMLQVKVATDLKVLSVAVMVVEITEAAETEGMTNAQVVVVQVKAVLAQEETITVSYTHLDVYKRQTIGGRDNPPLWDPFYTCVYSGNPLPDRIIRFAWKAIQNPAQ